MRYGLDCKRLTIPTWLIAWNIKGGIFLQGQFIHSSNLENVILQKCLGPTDRRLGPIDWLIFVRCLSIRLFVCPEFFSKLRFFLRISWEVQKYIVHFWTINANWTAEENQTCIPFPNPEIFELVDRSDGTISCRPNSPINSRNLKTFCPYDRTLARHLIFST